MADKFVEKLLKKLKKKGLLEVDARIEDSVLFLSGRVDRYDRKVEAGYMGALVVKKKGLKGTVNDISVKGIEELSIAVPKVEDRLLEGRNFDVVIIGGGIIGVTAARELSRYKLKIAVLEKEGDLGLHASGRNDGMIHPGMAAHPGSLKAKYNVRGNELYTEAAEELDFKLQRPGSLLLFRTRLMWLLLPVLKNRCRRNGVPGARGMRRKEIAIMDENMTEEQKGGFFMPSAGIVSPKEVVYAYGENAAVNGVEFFFNTAVTGFVTTGGIESGKWISRIVTNRGNPIAKAVINAAGVWSDIVAGYAEDRFFSIHPRKGVDAILDKKCGQYVKHIAGMPSSIVRSRSHSKGGGVVPCIEGNILLGPTAREVPDREDYSTASSDIEELKKHLKLNRRIKLGDIITYYGGIRAATWEEDFIICRSQKSGNLIHAAGIQSPGFASAPAIAEELSRLAAEVLSDDQAGGEIPERDPDFNAIRKGPPRPAELSPGERDALIARDPAYGRIVCRCEEISEGEVRDALSGPVPAVSVDGVKRRTRAGTGRCHGSFCLSRVMEIIARERGLELSSVLKEGEGSWLVTRRGDGDEN